MIYEIRSPSRRNGVYEFSFFNTANQQEVLVRVPQNATGQEIDDLLDATKTQAEQEPKDVVDLVADKMKRLNEAEKRKREALAAP